MNLNADQIIKELDLIQHPEGGYFREFYRSENIINDKYSLLTSVYFLLKQGDKSLIHKIPSVEIWNFLLGDPLVLVTLSDSGELVKTTLGSNILTGEKLDAKVEGNTWMGSYLPDNSEFALVTCNVSPGFEFDDLVFAKKDELLAGFPNHKEVIEMLT